MIKLPACGLRMCKQPTKDNKCGEGQCHWDHTQEMVAAWERLLKGEMGRGSGNIPNTGLGGSPNLPSSFLPCPNPKPPLYIAGGRSVKVDRTLAFLQEYIRPSGLTEWWYWSALGIRPLPLIQCFFFLFFNCLEGIFTLQWQSRKRRQLIIYGVILGSSLLILLYLHLDYCKLNKSANTWFVRRRKRVTLKSHSFSSDQLSI